MDTRIASQASSGSNDGARFNDASESVKSFTVNSDAEERLSLGGAAGLFMHSGSQQIQYTKLESLVREGWPAWRLNLLRALESETAEFTMGFLIVVNAIFIIVDTDARAEPGGESPKWLSVFMLVLLQVYILDLLLRLVAYHLRFFDSGMNIFDLIVVSVDAISLVLESLGVGFGVSVSVLRILRLGRLVRFIKVLRIFHELYVMLHLMMSALRAIAWGTVLMAVMLTIWSIIAVEVLHPLNMEIADNTDAYDGCERCGRAFASVMDSNLTFFQTIIAGDSWGQVSVTLIEHYPPTAVLLVTVILSINLGLMNLVVTVIVDKAQEAREENVETRVEEKRRQFEEAKMHMNEMCRLLDDDNSGQLSLDELITGYRQFKPFRETLTLMDVCENDLSVVFGIMDEDASGTVSYSEFVEQLYKMKTQDSHTTIVFIRAYVKEIRSKVEEQLNLLKSSVQDQMQAVDANIMKLTVRLDKLPSTALATTETAPGPQVGGSQAPRKSTGQSDTASQTESKLVHAASNSVGSSKLDGRPGSHNAPHLLEADHSAALFKLNRQFEEQLALELRNSEILARIAGFSSISEFDSVTEQMGTVNRHPRDNASHPSAAPAHPRAIAEVQMPVAKSTWFYRSPVPEGVGRCCQASQTEVVKRV